MQIPMKRVCFMRLYSIYRLCDSLIDVISGITFSSKNVNKEFFIDNWQEYKSALSSLRTVPFFKATADDIYKSIPVFVREDARPIIDNNTKNSLANKNNKLVAQMRTIIDLYKSMSLNSGGHGIDIKIPDCKDLKEYIWYLRELDFIFSQCPYLSCENESIEFGSVDVGSNWLHLIIAVSAGTATLFYILKNLAAILDKAFVLQSHYITIRQQEEVLKITRKKSELADSEKQIFDTLKKTYMDSIVSQLEEEIAPLEDGEERGRVEKSLEKLASLLDKGVQIYASLDTSKDIQKLFPALDETEQLPDTILKYLEAKTALEDN